MNELHSDEPKRTTTEKLEISPIDSRPTEFKTAKSTRSLQRRRVLLSFGLLAFIVASGFAWKYRRGIEKMTRYAPTAARGVLPGGIRRVAAKTPTAAKIVRASHAQIGTHYNARYRVISYPGGDVPSTQGACTDVVIRALRAVNVDLQKSMHEDMTKNFRSYPQQWGLKKTDKNIDHRRVPNQMKFFARFGQTLPIAVNRSTLASWQPGDIVCWDMQNGQLHTGVISDGLSSSGVPLVIHNGWLCVEDDSLTRWKVIGHYRYPKPKVS